MILYVPIDRARITAIVYHQMEGGDTLDLTPSGNLLDAGIIDRIERQIIGSTATGPDYFIASGSTASVDVGAGAGTQVYSPVNGTIVGITPHDPERRRAGARSCRSSRSPTPAWSSSSRTSSSTPRCSIGQQVTASQEPTLLGTVADLSKVLKMELARYTADAGNHAHIELRPTPVPAIP